MVGILHVARIIWKTHEISAITCACHMFHTICMFFKFFRTFEGEEAHAYIIYFFSFDALPSPCVPSVGSLGPSPRCLFSLAISAGKVFYLNISKIKNRMFHRSFFVCFA